MESVKVLECLPCRNLVSLSLRVLISIKKSRSEESLSLETRIFEEF